MERRRWDPLFRQREVQINGEQGDSKNDSVYPFAVRPREIGALSFYPEKRGRASR